MIKLTRPECPTELTAEIKASLTDEFLKTGNSVWNKSYIRAGLRAMSGGKCAFCECKLEEESKYLEVEHFAHKDKYKDQVVEWKNLLPACRRCNGQKSTHDVIIEPIINPAEDDPRASLTFYCYRFSALDQKGQTTLETLSLNDYNRLTLGRFKIGDNILNQLDELAISARSYSPGVTTIRTNNRISLKLRNLLIEAQPSAEYAGTAATIILSSPDYEFVKTRLSDHGLWTKEFSDFDQVMQSIAYT